MLRQMFAVIIQIRHTRTSWNTLSTIRERVDNLMTSLQPINRLFLMKYGGIYYQLFTAYIVMYLNVGSIYQIYVDEYIIRTRTVMILMYEIYVCRKMDATTVRHTQPCVLHTQRYGRYAAQTLRDDEIHKIILYEIHKILENA